jgi:hypothetical protein
MASSSTTALVRPRITAGENSACDTAGHRKSSSVQGQREEDEEVEDKEDVDDPNEAAIGLDVDVSEVGDDEEEEAEAEMRLTILECLSNIALNDLRDRAISSSTI